MPPCLGQGRGIEDAITEPKYHYVEHGMNPNHFAMSQLHVVALHA